MKLQDRLDRHRQAFEKKAPPEALAVMHGATEALRASGMVAKALHAGDKAPAFTLNNQNGIAVSSERLLTSGAIVLSFYRGRW